MTSTETNNMPRMKYKLHQGLSYMPIGIFQDTHRLGPCVPRLTFSLLSELVFKGYIHNTCLYRITCRWEDIIICRQVHDFAHAYHNEHILKDLLDETVRKVRIVARESTMKRFNGADIDQTRLRGP